MPLAIITGASRGIGAAYARELAMRGYDLLLVARDTNRLNQLATALQKHNTSITIERQNLDLANPHAAKMLYEWATSFNRPVDLVIQNAGFGLYGNFVTMPMNKVLQMVQLHVLQITEATRLFLPDLVAQGTGAIIIVSSVAGFIPIPYMAEYAATKAYLNAFSEAVAHELRGTGVTLQVCCPGFTDTDFHHTAGHYPRHTFWPQSPEQVARVSLNALSSRRTLVTIGWQGRLAYWISRLSTKKLLLPLTARVVKPPSSYSHPPSPI
ncbi:MAG TPA: SDR family oxidoreductase [Nitrospirales bacterium]|nr:SDR family oxidoreductase [Nitrospirales bacterium]